MNNLCSLEEELRSINVDKRNTYGIKVLKIYENNILLGKQVSLNKLE
jgi:hypothetical protein